MTPERRPADDHALHLCGRLISLALLGVRKTFPFAYLVLSIADTPAAKSYGQTNAAAIPLFGHLIPLIGRKNAAVRQCRGIRAGLKGNQSLARSAAI
jgi:hypothetical protein